MEERYVEGEQRDTGCGRVRNDREWGLRLSLPDRGRTHITY